MKPRQPASPLPASRPAVLLLVALPLALALLAPAARADGEEAVDYVADVRFALEEIEKNCGVFFKLKDIDWKKVSKTFLAEAKKVKTDQDHLVLLVRLLARLEDGHAAVRPLEKGKAVAWPDDGRQDHVGPGMFWCRIGKKIFVKNSWSSAESSGVLPGMEIVKVDGWPAAKWLEKRIAEVSDLKSLSSEQQAFFYTTHWGLADAPGTRLELEIKDHKGKKKKRTVTYTRASTVPWGPAFFPDGLEGDKDISYTTLPSGYGYIHLRRCPGDLPERVDKALAALGNVPGLILDFRANGGGAFDHEAFMGRFIPEGKTMAFAKSYESSGPNPYGGPIVVIVDGNTRSAGETGSGIFKEDGRAYLIGESPTAGMSSQKTTIDLPSGLFALYVSIGSNMGRSNNGRGLEGIGTIPHEIVEYDPKDLAADVDTITKRAEELLDRYPQKAVPYNPARFGWSKK